MEEDIVKVSALKDGETCHINWFQGGGGEVTRVGDSLRLTEVPMFGGEGSYPLSFSPNDVEALVKTAHSWT